MSNDDLSLFKEEAEATSTPPPQRGIKPRKRLRDRWLLLTILVVLGAILAGLAVVAGWYGKSIVDGMNSVKREQKLAPPVYSGRPDETQVKEGEKYAPLNILLMGADARTPNERGRSDVLMVLHIPGNRKGMYLTSIPRDYWVPIPGHGTAKINAAYSWGGPPLAVRTVEELTDVRIDHTVWLNFDGFMKVIDSLGGVSVYNRYDSTIDGVHFPKGMVELDGAKGLLFVRNRYDLPNGDFDRAERQRDVIKAVIEKLLSKGTLADPQKFRDAITTLGPNFTVDPGLTNKKIFDLGTQMRITSSQQIESLQAPIGPFGTSRDGQWYVSPDWDKLKKMSAALRTDTMAEYVKGS